MALLQALAAVALLVGTTAPAQANHITATLVAEPPLRSGAPATLALLMKPANGWHGYWANPGDAGFGMVLKWQLPSGASAGEPAYPVPQTLLISGLMNHVFEQDYAVLVPLTLPPGASGALSITVDAQWLACTLEVCVPEQARLSVTLPAGATARPDPRFDQWRARLPAPLGSAAQFALTPATLRLAIPLPAALKLDDPHLFLGEDRVIDYAATQRFSRRGDLLIVELARKVMAGVAPTALTGVLRLNARGDGVTIAASPGPVPATGIPLVTSSPALAASLPALLLAALLGGLLLNVMPCVFPILSLKALSLARAGGGEAEARSEGLAYSAGVILACTALGGLLLALRAGGSEVGWAFQLQEPGVVAALLALAVAITANLVGVYEFAIPGFASSGSPRGAFATGLLAAFVATPCTGPFMAAAMGAALLLPVVSALALFAALGVGLALPFLALAFIPALRRALPRPGAWMVWFRRAMAVPMALTALALLWLASRLGGLSFAGFCAVLALALVGLLVMVGRGQRAGRVTTPTFLTGAAALLVLAVVLLPQAVRAPSAEAQGIIPTEKFSEDALAKARASGRPVFAWFTADWCLTCKVNERVAIEREATRDAFARGRVIVLRGDWTRRDPAITRYLTAQGAAGVPLYVWYPAGGGTPQVLEQALTPDRLERLVAETGPARLRKAG